MSHKHFFILANHCLTPSDLTYINDHREEWFIVDEKIERDSHKSDGK